MDKTSNFPQDMQNWRILEIRKEWVLILTFAVRDFSGRNTVLQETLQHMEY